VLSFEPELERFRAVLPNADRLIARERREVFSLYPELRLLSWGGALLVATAAGILLKNNLERIGPLALAAGVGIAAAACYIWAWLHRQRASIVDDYVLLLGALLLSADVGFLESQFHIFDRHWPRHLLLLALVHGAAAYRFGSRMVLSLSIAALAAWLGIDQRQFDGPGGAEPTVLALRAFLCAALVVVWTLLDRRFRRERTFDRVFEHFAANLALWGGFVLLFEKWTRPIGTLVTLVVAAAVIVWGFRTRSEPFVLYAYVYAVIALDVLVIDLLNDSEAALFFLVISMIAAVAGLFVLHARFREEPE
jgi:hypothetical protein